MPKRKQETDSDLSIFSYLYDEEDVPGASPENNNDEQPKEGCCPKPRRCPRKRKPCPRKRRKPACPRPRRRCCSRPGPITSNGYLNFLRSFRRKNCGLSPHETVRQGAKAWCCMSEREKDRYRKQACRVTKSCKMKQSSLCRRAAAERRKRRSRR